jgi:hypothetical protein
MKTPQILMLFLSSLFVFGCNSKSEEEIRALSTQQIILEHVADNLTELDTQLNKAKEGEGEAYIGAIIAFLVFVRYTLVLFGKRERGKGKKQYLMFLRIAIFAPSKLFTLRKVALQVIFLTLIFPSIAIITKWK